MIALGGVNYLNGKGLTPKNKLNQDTASATEKEVVILPGMSQRIRYGVAVKTATLIVCPTNQIMQRSPDPPPNLMFLIASLP